MSPSAEIPDSPDNSFPRIADMPLHELYRVFEVGQREERLAAQRERLWRERALEELRRYIPEQPVMPPYSKERGPYFNEARALNRRSGLPLAELRPELSEKSSARLYAVQYIASDSVRARLRPISRMMEPADLKDFFAGNLFGLVATARSVARLRFEQARNSILRERFPGIELVSASNLRTSIARLPITRGAIAAAHEMVAALSPEYAAPYPDFYQLAASDQEDVVRAFGVEWERLCLLLHDVDPNILAVRVSRHKIPLVYWPVETLRSAIETNPSVDPAKFCHAFMSDPVRFTEAVGRLRTESAAAALAVSEAARQAELERPVQGRGEMPFVQYDHIRLVLSRPTGTKRYYLPIERPNALLAARVLEAVARAGDRPHVEGREVANLIWSEMPVEERRLFTAKTKDLQRKTGVIDARILEIFRRLLSGLGITRETTGERFKLEKRAATSLELAPPEEADLLVLKFIFPPGTLRERVAMATGDPVPEHIIAAAGEVLSEYVGGSERIEPQLAHDLLAFITDPYGKRALGIRLQAAGRRLAFGQVMQHLHDRIAYSLGEGAASAHRHRMIAGYNATGEAQVRQVGGRLPIRTFVTQETIGRWYIQP